MRGSSAWWNISPPDPSQNLLLYLAGVPLGQVSRGWVSTDWFHDAAAAVQMTLLSGGKNG